MSNTVTASQLDSLRDSLKQVVDAPEEEQLNEAEDKDSNKDDKKDDKEQSAKPPKEPEEPKTLQEAYGRLKKLGEKGETLGPNETERHQRAIQYLEQLIEQLHNLLGDREQEAEEGSAENESSG